jgi:hypothetical protein
MPGLPEKGVGKVSEISKLYGIPGLKQGFKFSVGDNVEILTNRYGNIFCHRIGEIQEIVFGLCDLPNVDVKVVRPDGNINILRLDALEIEFPDILNGRIVCVNKCSYDFPVTVGKIYMVTNGEFALDNGEIFRTTTLKMLNITLDKMAHFIKIVEDEYD